MGKNNPKIAPFTMASIVILMLDRRRKNKDGLYPICLVINFKRTRSYVNLQRSVDPDFWDQHSGKIKNGAKVTPSPAEVNSVIHSRLTDAQRIVSSLDLGGELADMTHAELKSRIENKSKLASFSLYLDRIINEYKKHGHFGQASIYMGAKRFLINYGGGDRDYKFEDVNYRFLRKAEDTFKPRVPGSRNGLGIYLRTIRAVWNRAIKEGIVKKDKYPFDTYRIKTSRAHKTAISGADMRKIAEMELPENTPAWHGRNMFLFSFYTRGMNFADIAKLRVRNIRDGRIIYIRSKTKQTISIKLDDDLNAILAHYLDEKGPDVHIFPVITLEKQAAEQTMKYHAVVNHALKRWAKLLQLDPSLSFNTARHTWATLGRDKNLPIEVISEGLGHADIPTTQIYLDSFSTEVIDAATALVKF